ncbi:TBC1 domain family member 30 isoform X2 [Cylas formicarius]|uniref:TBC1 domain family member 30 isoform X2 n=1 Tax=Cylas formicarius TaxID=197179 RepID=UPI002958C3D0|nr:TBC1 domain family member 30 isoform X2 [Cylas formicarius]
MDGLLRDIYGRKSHERHWAECSTLANDHDSIRENILLEKDAAALRALVATQLEILRQTGFVLSRRLKRRDALRRRQQAHCHVISLLLTKQNHVTDEAIRIHFTMEPGQGESGFSQWVAAMKMVAQLPGGIPADFRSRLWLQLADRYLTQRGVEWSRVRQSYFSEWAHPDDDELGIQIVKDLHRTGCSLFCGEDGQENQVLLKRVLLAYARWNKNVGYCQGFNMLAALILQVTEKNESDSLKLMIYLIEGVLPDSYFADNLRGLSVDMAVFRELLRSKLPRLAKHLDMLQNAAKDGSRSYEPPLTNVFTIQWFLTLFCNCLPQATVLRVWDLILLEGNEVLLRTALCIWQILTERILRVRSADEFYGTMGDLTRELLEANVIDSNSLVKAVVAMGPLTDLKNLRDHYLYSITPWSLSDRGDKRLKVYPKHAVLLDINTLKRQYAKLKQRQRQAHVIFSAAVTKQPPPATPIAINHLFVGRSALVPTKRAGPLKGTIPPARRATSATLQWKDATATTPKQDSSSSSSTDTELCDEEGESAASESEDEDFRRFLTDRVKGLDHDRDEEGKTRRNSLRALEIIQENSAILHRIMRARLTPSPPSPEVQSTSKYHSILEKSKSLDERYHALFSDSKTSGLSESKSEGVIVQTIPEDNLIELAEDSEETSPEISAKESMSCKIIQENSELLRSVSDRRRGRSEPREVDGGLYVIDVRLSPPKEEEGVDKSPSKAFSPFPVNQLSRQTREVPLKLGMYKK